MLAPFFRLNRRPFVYVIFFLICACGGWSRASAQDVWLGGAGNWSDGTKWSAGVPGSTSNVLIDNGNPVQSPVTMDIGGQANNLTIDSDDSLSFSNNTNLTINGSNISNAGTISLNSLGNFTYLFIANGATLNGSGTVTMSNNSQNQIDGNSGVTLTNKSTIQGVGQVGPHFALANHGTVNANVSGGVLLVDQETGLTDTNTATMEATNGGILQLYASGTSSINNTGGTIKAMGTNSQVLLQASVTGGTLTTSSGGTIVQPVSTSSTLTTLANSGTFSILNNGTVNLSGTITNTGTFELSSTGSFTDLFVPSAATVTGSGTITMSNNSFNQVDGNSGATFTNQSTIQGVGQVGDHFTLVNQGTINANVSGATLAVRQDTGSTATNTATMEATNGGILQLETSGSGSINNTGGTIEAVGANSQVQFTGGTINGGTFKTSSGGTIVVPGSSGPYISGVTNAGTISMQNGAYLNLLGNLTNNGTINANSTGGYTVLFLPATSVTLFGKGRVMLTNTPFSIIDGNGGLTFTNQSTIQGGGQIGAHFTFSNNGTLHVPAGNTLNITAPFTNFDGNTGTLNGGAYLVAGTLQFTNAVININSANITLSGSAAQIVNQSNVNAMASLLTNTSTGAFTVTAGQQYTTTLSGSLSNAGKVTVGKNSSFTVSCNPNFQCPYVQTAGTTTVDGTLRDNLAVSAVQIKGGKLFGAGTIAASVASSGAVTAGDTLAKAGILSPSTYTQNATGSLNIQIGGTTVGTQYSQLAVGNGASLNGTLNIKLINGFVPAVGDTFTILTTSALSGRFSTVNGLSINGSEHFVISYGATSVTLTVESGA